MGLAWGVTAPILENWLYTELSDYPMMMTSEYHIDEMTIIIL